MTGERYIDTKTAEILDLIEAYIAELRERFAVANAELEEEEESNGE